VKRKYCLKPANENRILLLILILLLVVNCSKEKVPQEVLVKTYVENLIAEEKYSANLDSLQYHKRLVFEKNKITEYAFKEALKLRKDDQDAWEDFFKQSNKYLDSLKKIHKID
jgi:hypothetical protein